MLYPLNQQNNTDNSEVTLWTNVVKIKIRVIQSQEKIYTVEYKVDANSTCLKFIEALADFSNETKYSISLFYKGQKINVNDQIANLGIQQSNQTQIICLKGGLDQPKIFNRFTNIDSPERQLSYIADEEAHDAISFIPNKDIRLAGFSVYYVT